MQIEGHFSYRPGCVLRASGPDASEFLQGQFSNDLSSMSVGDVVYGLWLDRKGKIVADSFVLRRGDEEYFLASYYSLESVVFERLDAYLIMEEVELEGLTEEARGLSVFGPRDKVCDICPDHVPETGSFLERNGVIVFWGRRSSEPSLEVLALSAQGRESLDGLHLRIAEKGSRVLGETELAEFAIRAKTPRIGISFGASDLPQELGLDADAVSFNKGCYLGQEVMARLHAMGRVRKELAVFSIGKTVTDELPVDLLDENGKRQGALREVAYPESGGIGLGVLNLSFAGRVLLAGEVEVTRMDREDIGDG